MLTVVGAASQNTSVEHEHSHDAVLVTGAAGQIGRELCRQLRACGATVVATDLKPDAELPVIARDLTSQEQVAQLFHSQPIAAVVHLAGILPSAFLADPLRGMEVNVTASCRLLREAIKQRVQRFVFASSMSVYGFSPSQ